jgi:RNA polymerase II subunit A small phosphatase-like protein
LINNQNNNIININVNKQNIVNNDDSFINFYLPNKLKENINKKTLLIDLDETLVHSSFRPLPINADINFNIFYQNKPHMINVLIRPYVQEFLKKMSNLYEIIIFTASVPQYANPLLDKLDKNKYIHHRLYRQHCISLYGLFIKDLRRIGRDLKNTILLDNNPISYLLNQENGLPIKTWHSDKKDQELIKIIPLLEYLAKIEINDVRQVIRKIIVNNAIDYNLVKDLINKNNNNNMMNYNSNQKIMVRSNSFSNLKRNDVVNGNKYLTPKKDMKNNILINN